MVGYLILFHHGEVDIDWNDALVLRYEGVFGAGFKERGRAGRSGLPVADPMLPRTLAMATRLALSRVFKAGKVVKICLRTIGKIGV